MKYSVNQTKAALAELQTLLHWSLDVIKPAAVVGNMPEDVKIRCQTSAVPEATEENNKLELQGHTINYVGKTTKNGEIALQFVEGTDARVTAYFTKWQAARWNGDGSDTSGKQALTKDLKADIKLSMMGPDDKVTQVYKLIGCIPRFEKGASLGQTADPMITTVTMEYDDFHVEAGGIVW